MRNAIANSEVVVYTIKVESAGGSPGYAEALEKYLLAVCYRMTGTLPPLNSIF